MFEIWVIGICCDLACLREAASAKAGAWDLVLAFHFQSLSI